MGRYITKRLLEGVAITRFTPEVEERVKELEIKGVPTTLFIDGGGREGKRLIGYVGPERFFKEMAAVG